jgi:signal transduction histidine kinase
VWCYFFFFFFSSGISYAKDELEKKCPDPMETAIVEFHPARGLNEMRAVCLPHRWDMDFPGVDGEATYHLILPIYNGEQAMALMFSRIGNQAIVEINGKSILKLGDIGQANYDAAKTPQIAQIPSEYLVIGQTNKLAVRVSIQALRWGGLGTVRYGPRKAIDEEYATQRHFRYTSSFVFAVSLAFMGFIALALWVRMSDRLFACFAIASFLGIFRNLDKVWADIPIPWPMWGIITSTAYAWHLALMCLFVLFALDLQQRNLHRAIWGYMLVAFILASASFINGKPLFWTIALQLLVPVGLIALGLALHCAWVSKEKRGTAIVLAGAGTIAILAGLHDLGWVRLALGNGKQHSVTPHAMFLFVVIMAGIIVDRYARNAASLIALNRTLETRIASKERELQLTFDQLQQQRATQAKEIERQRIMRDLHDGVGAQLVGLLNLIKHADCEPKLMEEHVNAALDEMRLAVDSMQIADGDITTALATLRYRIQPRLHAAGITLNWTVDNIAMTDSITPHAVLQIQRILLEALTNILKHADADTVWVKCCLEKSSFSNSSITLQVADNGKGIAISEISHLGQGLRNMQLRAESLGATFTFSERNDGGTRVEVIWPISE